MKRLLLTLASCLQLARPALADCPNDVSTRPIPLPIIATQPNEGNTYGFMPVFIRVCDATGRTESIVAPSVSWNETIRWTGTFRYYKYPSDIETLLFTASQSTRINSNAHLVWNLLPKSPGAWTRELELKWERSAFYRFFGIGPDTSPNAESSYTRLLGRAHIREGLNLGSHWNTGIDVAFHRDVVQALGVMGLPLSPRVFPDAPGMSGASTVTQLLDLRYDDRPNREYSDHGYFFDASGGIVEGLMNSPVFGRGTLNASALFPELGWLSGAARGYASLVSSSRAPFYEQSSLGGEVLLRGFTDDRFIDENAWTLEVEQRIRILQLHIFGVTADWRVDPFLAIGQVFGGFQQIASNPRVTEGLGFRAFVHPNVSGRVDVAMGGEGLEIYVELGYPY